MPRVNMFKPSEKKPLLQDIEAQTPNILDASKVCHVIVIPNYKEDEELLDRTLSRLVRTLKSKIIFLYTFYVI